MRSRTSRGVPAWSGGKELYIGRAISGIGTSFGVTGIVPGPPEGSRGSTGWGHLPPGATWAVGGAPWPTWAKGTSPKKPMRLGFQGRKSPRRGRHLLGALGRRDSSLGRHPPRRLDLLGPAPPLGLPIYSGERRASHNIIFGASLSLSNTSSSSIVLGEALPEYCSSTITTPLCCCWSFHHQPLLPLCWIKTEETSC